MTKVGSNPKIVFVRHAHRDKPIPDEDNGVSEKGRAQTADLVKDFKKEKLPQSQDFWSSPKKRCIQTLEPLAEEAGSPLKIEKLLDEQSSKESQRDFQGRVEQLVNKIKNTKVTLYLCSHGDLIPEAINQLTGKGVDVAKGQALILEKDGDRWDLK